MTSLPKTWISVDAMTTFTPCRGLLSRPLTLLTNSSPASLILAMMLVGHTGTRPRIALASFLPAPKLISSCSAPMAFSMAMTWPG